MISKPPACKGCPFASAGAYFVPDEVDTGQKVVIVAQNPGSDEEHGQRFLGWFGGGERYEACAPSPMIGKTGYELDKHLLPLAGLAPSDVRRCNVIRCRVRGTNELPPVQSKVFREAVQHCQRAYWQPLREGTKVIALGAHALWTLTGESGAEEDSNDDTDDVRANLGIVGWRGWTRPYRPQWGAAEVDTRVFVTFHPAYYFRAHWMKPVGRLDWRKIGRWLRGEWPEPFPAIDTDMPARWPAELAYDTEYVPNGGRLLRASFAWREGDSDAPRVHVVESADLRLIEGAPRVIAHNMEADWPYVRRIFGTEPAEWDDTMDAHSVLHGTLRHSLDFIGSLYARTDRWKHLEQSDEGLYSGADALATWDCWQVLKKQLAGDRLSKEIYDVEMKPSMLVAYARPSIKLNQDKVKAHLDGLNAAQQRAVARGAAAAGWPLSVSSPHQVSRWLGLKEGKSAQE